MLSRLVAYARGLVRRRAIDAEVDEELRSMWTTKRRH